MTNRMMVIGTYANEFDARLAMSELEAADIPAQMLTDGVGVEPHLSFVRGIRLAVPESEAQLAREVLDTPGEFA